MNQSNAVSKWLLWTALKNDWICVGRTRLVERVGSLSMEKNLDSEDSEVCFGLPPVILQKKNNL